MTTDLRADSMTGEQFVFEERTTDPTTTQEGERWIRTDLNSGDKIATLRVDVGASILDVPIFPTGTSQDSVVESIRVRVGSQTGYLPAVPETNANYPALRLQHNGQVYGYHDEQGVFAFFDVSIDGTNEPVTEGDNLNVSYSVLNTGYSVGNTQDIRLQIDNTEEDRDTSITLPSSSSTTGTLTWTTPSSSAGTYTASVLSDDDTASRSVTIDPGPAIPDSGVLRYSFEDDSATDVWGNFDGTVYGATHLASGAPDGSGAFDLDGSGDHIVVPSGATDAIENTGACSVYVLVNLNSTASDYFLFANNGSGRLILYMDTGDGADGYRGGSDKFTSASVSGAVAGSYQSVVLTVGAGSVEVYTDGSLTSSVSSPLASSINGLDIGRDESDGRYLNGQVADFRIYDKVLSSVEVSNLHSTGSIGG